MPWVSTHQHIIIKYTANTTLPSLPSEKDESPFFTESKKGI